MRASLNACTKLQTATGCYTRDDQDLLFKSQSGILVILAEAGLDSDVLKEQDYFFCDFRFLTKIKYQNFNLAGFFSDYSGSGLDADSKIFEAGWILM